MWHYLKDSSNCVLGHWNNQKCYLVKDKKQKHIDMFVVRQQAQQTTTEAAETVTLDEESGNSHELNQYSSEIF